MAATDQTSSKLRYVNNPHIAQMEEDILFHIHMSTKTLDFKQTFGDVKFVCIGGSANRMKAVAEYMAQVLKLDMTPENLTGTSDRYVMYKVGPVLVANHGIGVPSMSILLNEVFKLLSHAEADGVTLFRLGTSGGLGLEPGTVVITSEAVNGLIEPVYEQVVLAKRKTTPAILDENVANAILACQSENAFKVVKGKTMCGNDFYEGQGRVDGALCSHTEKEKMEYLDKLHKAGVRNIEMECVALAAMTHQVNMKAAIVCVTLLDRLKGDQVTSPHETLAEFEKRPGIVVGKYIQQQLAERQ